MNERIKELASNAWEYARERQNSPDEDNEDSYYRNFQEKFAKLIVQECMLVNAETNKFFTGEAIRLVPEVPAYKTVMKSYETIFNEKLKEHFGVDNES